MCRLHWLLCGILGGLFGFWALKKDFHQDFASLLHRFSGYKKEKESEQNIFKLLFRDI